ncbi:MAG: hypothetical protein KKE83_02350 [Proteobacteria bacterium]|nr:hypothetical protein [Pseudomonadota bacterium]MBU1546058.1 hypothetical protein [Pseudomonadota bacterium]MBU2618506.1 hypothetical protein [Pseudomonadota bacterium]
MALYYFAGDKAPGNTGQGVMDVWFVVNHQPIG